MAAPVVHFPGSFFVVVFGLAVVVMSASPAAAAPGSVGLGRAGSFAVLAGSTVSNTGPSVISGDLGVSPGTAVTGFPPGTVSNGTVHAADAVAAQAQADLTTAYDDAAGRAPTATVTADLGGQTLVSGVYRGGALGLTGTLSLDAEGDPTAVFIFQAASTVITASGSRVLLLNGATACNVFWQVGSSATLGTTSAFVGTVLALTSVTANTAASVTGRLLARNAAVTLDSNTVSRPTCAASTPVSTPTATATATSATTPTPTAPTTAPTATTTPATATTTAPTATTTPSGSTQAGSGSGGGSGNGGGSGGGGDNPRTVGGGGGPAEGAGDTPPSTTSSTPPQLPPTGADLTVTGIGGVLAVALGGIAVLASGRAPVNVCAPPRRAPGRARHRRGTARQWPVAFHTRSRIQRRPAGRHRS